MKTQINTLVNGSQKVVGTNREVRAQIAAQVKAENQSSMIIRFREATIELTANWSLSGKSVTYLGTFPESLYREMFGNVGIPRDGAECCIQMNDDMSVWVTTNSKFRNSRKKGYQLMDNSEIEII